MNYIIEINRFYDWLETNPISDSSIVLWHALMHINNKCGWKEEFAVAISTLTLKTGLSKSSILRARNSLQEAGRIDFRSRNGQMSAVYTLIAFHSEAQSGTQTGTQTGAQSGTQTVPINKLKETKLNQTFFSGANAPAPEKKDVKPKKEKPTRDYWECVIQTWVLFYKSKTNTEYGLQPKDFRDLVGIYDFLKKRSEQKNWEWTEKNAVEGFRYFLQRAWEKDDWLKNNFSISNIFLQRNQILNGQSAAKTKQATGADVSNASAFAKINGMPD